MLGSTVATTSSRALVAALERLAIDPTEILVASGLTAAQVADPDGRLPGEGVTALWRAALERTGDPGLGLRVAVAVPFGAYRVIDFLAASAPTVGERLVRVGRYFPIINSALGWEITDGERGNKRVDLVHAGAGELPRPYAEYAVAVTILHCRRASGFDWPLDEVRFAFSPPPSTAEHARVLGAPVRFQSPRSGFTIARATWDRPTEAPSSDLLRTLEDHATRLVAALRDTREVSAQVARLIAEELHGGEPTLGRIARRLAMSPRTLQRRLELESTTFASVLDETRRHIAIAYVKDPALALTEVAYLLGFSEQSAFTRAFQRWYGAPPSQYRRQAS